MREWIRLIREMASDQETTNPYADKIGRVVRTLQMSATHPKVKEWVSSYIPTWINDGPGYEAFFQNQNMYMDELVTKIEFLNGKGPARSDLSMNDIRDEMEDERSDKPKGHGLKTVDIDGPAFKSWFGNSKVVNHAGGGSSGRNRRLGTEDICRQPATAVSRHAPKHPVDAAGQAARSAIPSVP
jgi:hypothetical protein